jgi:ADP-ribose pyrophosphatase YjhB (NUDIX family)
VKEDLVEISERDTVKGKILVSVAAIIEGEGNKILLIWEGDTPYHQQWVVPGGYVKPKETVQEAVVREVREETGLEVIPTRLIGIYDDFIADEEDQPLHHIIISYIAKIIFGEIIVTQESMEYAWINVVEVLKSDRVPDVFKRIVSDFRKLRQHHLFDLFLHKVS